MHSFTSLRLLSSSALLLVLSGSVACSSSDEAPPAETDSGTVADSATDTAVVKDTSPSETSTGCGGDLDPGYACPSFTKVAAASTCSEAALQAYADACITDDFSVGAGCAAWKAANAACSTCVEAWSFDDDKVYPDDLQCYEQTAAGCGAALACESDCTDNVCALCEADSDEQTACINDALSEGGRCYALAAKKSDTCLMDDKTLPCDVSQYYSNTTDLTKLKSELVRLLRGACRDNGDWSKSEMGGTGDAGTDASTETGSDAAAETATDAATEAATDAAEAG